jgi:hypothetical protein
MRDHRLIVLAYSITYGAVISVCLKASIYIDVQFFATRRRSRGSIDIAAFRILHSLFHVENVHGHILYDHTRIFVIGASTYQPLTLLLVIPIIPTEQDEK